MNLRAALCVGVCLVVNLACSESSPSTPSSGGAPTLDAPAADQQLTTLRPTLRVKNATASGNGAKTYEFQISDRNDFGTGSGPASAHYAVSMTKTGIAEGSSVTEVIIDQDLQPATRFYWRSRRLQGSTPGEWSSTFTLRTQIVGYNKAGELYDPLVNGETVAEARVNGTSFVAGKGLRLQDTHAHVRYRLQQTIGNGEFSLDVEGISNNPQNVGKLKLFSMDDDTSNHYSSDFLMNVQYRGSDGNPDYAISFKMLMGEDTDARKLEPDFNERSAGVRALDAARTYHWKATWGNFIQVVVQDGGVGGVNGSGSGRGGSTTYDKREDSAFNYDGPSPHYAYLGVNNFVEDTGSWPATYRNVWIGNKGRPASLGSAMTPLP